jgi:hypothetical protein
MTHVLHAAQDVFQQVFGTKTALADDFTIYLCLDEKSKAAFIANCPGLSDAQRTFYAQVDGTGLTGSDSGAWWAPKADGRLDGAVRHVYGTLMLREFNISIDVAWAWESIGLYLTRELIGTRLTWYITPVDPAQTGASKKGSIDWTKKLLAPGTNWMNEGYRLLRAGDTYTLGAALTRPMNKMSPQDLFLSYVVGAYLLESQAERLPQLLRKLGEPGARVAAGTPQAWSSVLAMDFNSFHARLVRWLGERRGACAIC